VSVSMSDGSTFSGALTANPVGVVAISDTKTMVLARGLSPADDGVQQWGVTAAQNGVTVSSSIAVQVNSVGSAPAPAPPPSPPPAPQPPPCSAEACEAVLVVPSSSNHRQAVACCCFC
jgi:hypothetical protein